MSFFFHTNNCKIFIILNKSNNNNTYKLIG